MTRRSAILEANRSARSGYEAFTADKSARHAAGGRRGGELAERTDAAGEAPDDQVKERVIAVDPSAVASARSFVRDQCQAMGLEPELCDTVVLLTSEIVTNAILHARNATRLHVRGNQQQLRVEVADDNSHHPKPRAADPDALDGRGLAIVDMLAARWGVEEDPPGKTVWFEVQAA